MRRAHDIPPLVKAANLAHWFPPWKVTREQWSSMTWSAVLRIAVDTLLFSRIGMPLLSVVRTCNGCILIWRNRMWRHCEVVIIAALRRLQNGCRGHLYRIRVIGRWMSLLDPGHLVGLARGSGSLPRQLPWPSHRWPRGLFALIAPR